MSRQYEKDSDRDRLNLTPDVDQAHPEPNYAQQEQRLHHANYRPGATKDVNPAQHNSGDDD